MISIIKSKLLLVELKLYATATTTATIRATNVNVYFARRPIRGETIKRYFHLMAKMPPVLIVRIYYYNNVNITKTK